MKGSWAPSLAVNFLWQRAVFRPFQQPRMAAAKGEHREEKRGEGLEAPSHKRKVSKSRRPAQPTRAGENQKGKK